MMNTSSDRRKKRNVQLLQGAAEKLVRLSGVSFEWRRLDFPNETLPSGPQLGFIAQEIEEALPEAVRTDHNGYKSISLAPIVAVLVEALKETALERQIKESKLERQMDEMKQQMQRQIGELERQMQLVLQSALGGR
jgi:hypothetical protein